jgi:hypothetical protein
MEPHEPENVAPTDAACVNPGTRAASDLRKIVHGLVMRSVRGHHGCMRTWRHLGVTGLVSLAACGDQNGRATDSAARLPAPRVAIAECYRSPASAMGRTRPLDGHTAVAPGWIRFDLSGGTDSGTAQLIDADGAKFDARWRRTSGDSIEVRGLDDFMQIHLRALVSDSTLRGSGLVTSDADVQRDAAGRLEPLRREWALGARATSCTGAPVPSA